jgi:hypothetical protein
MTETVPISGIPNLGGVITPDDISSKGTGSYAADYVNWARIAHLLHVHAPGWQFALRQTAEGHHIWTAPDGSGYVVGYFTNGHQQTPDFPQACMDNRNNPIPAERITARVLTDTHRRCLCTAAAFTFGLGYELWARVEIENPMREEDAASIASASKPAVVKPAAKKLGASALTSEQVQELVNAVLKVNETQRAAVIKAFQQRFELPADKKAADYIKTTEHRDFLMQKLHEIQAPATA